MTAALCWHGTLSVSRSTWPEPSEEDGGGGSVVDGRNAKASVKRTKFQWHVADVELNLSPEPQEKLLWNHSLEEFQVPQADVDFTLIELKNAESPALRMAPFPANLSTWQPNETCLFYKQLL